MALCFVINPAAGRGKALRVWHQLYPLLVESKIEFTHLFTNGPGHATTLAEKAVADGCSACIGVGGDGTLHEILPALVGTNTALGCVPAGTGNDFARSLGVPRAPHLLSALFARPHFRRIDLPSVNNMPFLNVAGAGFDAVVADTVNRRFHALHGAAPYLLAVPPVLIQWRNAPITIKADSHPPLNTRALLVACGNMQYYGGGMRICPLANPTDGLLDLCIAGDIGKWEVLVTLPRIFSGRHITHPKCTYIQTSSVQVDGPPLPIQADGQIVGTLPATFALRQGGLLVLCPKDAAENRHE